MIETIADRLLQIPFTARSGDYQLKVEGNANGVRGGNGFVRNTTLNFLAEFLTILVQTNQLVFNMKQTSESLHVSE